MKQWMMSNRQRRLFRRGVGSMVLLLALASLTASSGAVGLAQGNPSWPRIALVERVTGLQQPVHIAHAGDSSGRLFVVERLGTIRLFKAGQLLPAPFLDITARVGSGSGEQGLLSVAFPADYAATGRFYVYYTDLDGQIVIARYHVSADPDVADPTSEQVVLTIPHPTYTNHNGGQLAFGPLDGYLYVGTGDGGGGGDPFENAQDPGVLLGKLLRIDVETGGPITYTIPATNPYTQTVGYRPELWALGLRNPWRFSFDRQTGDLYIGDVGQGNWEEVDFQPAASPGGENYGWDILEGTHCYEPSSGCTPPSAYVPPIIEYDHTLGCSITGGTVYRGAGYPMLDGIYFYADFCSGRIWGLRDEGGTWAGAQVADLDFTITTFGQDEAGRVYLADYGAGRVLELVPRFERYLPSVNRAASAVLSHPGTGEGTMHP
jgi:glucose/arabinose dehydrogenase